MVDVTKRDGRKEPFIREKVAVSAMKSGVSPDEARMIAQEVERDFQEGMKTEDIRSRVLEQLRARNPESEKSYLSFEESKRRAPQMAQPGMR